MLLGVLAQLRQILDGLAADLDVGILAQIQLGIDRNVGQVRKELEEFADELGGETLLFGLSLDGVQDLFVLFLMLRENIKKKLYKIWFWGWSL